MNSADDGRIESNFMSGSSPGGFRPDVMSGTEFFGADETQMHPFEPEPVEKPKDYQAMAEGYLYEKLTENGAVRSLEATVNMIDDDNGSGKGFVTIGKDAKKRRFEIPIFVNDGKIKLGNAIDMDADKVIDISQSPKLLFEPPDKKIIESRLQQTYDKHKDFFDHKPKDIHIDTMIKRWPSLTRAEAENFLHDRYMDNRPKVYAAVDKIKNKKNLAIGVALGIAGAIVLITMIRKRRSTEPVK
jgi:hypothetical protein